MSVITDPGGLDWEARGSGSRGLATVSSINERGKG